MTRILFIVSTLKRTGPTNQLHNLIRHLDREAFEPIVITLSPESSDSLWDDFNKLEVKVQSLNLSRLAGMLLAKRRLRACIENMQPDAIHTQGIRADSLMAALDLAIPWVMTARNFPPEDYLTKFGRFKGSLMVRQHFAAMRHCLNLISCSDTIKNQLSNAGITSSVVHNGVDSEKFYHVSSSQRQSLRQKLEIPINTSIFVAVGSLIPRKDMQTVVSAFNHLNDRNSVLILLGDGPLMPQLRELGNDSVLMPGNVDNVMDYLGAADLFISASLSEGLPNTVLEAMAMGLPCVLSDIGPHRELLGKDSELFFECGDSEKLTSLLEQMDSKKMSQLAGHSRNLVENYFSAATMSERYQKIYTDIITS